MLSDLLKIITLFVSALKSIKSPEKKKKKIAKQIHKIYLDLEVVVERGKAILEILGEVDDSDFSKVNLPVGMLLDQLRSLKILSTDLSDKSVSDILNLYIPEIKKGNFLIDDKEDWIFLFLRTLIDSHHPSKSEMDKCFEPFVYHEPEEKSFAMWCSITSLLLWYDEKGKFIGGMAPNTRDIEVCFSQRDKKALENNLNELDVLNGKIRAFLLETFQLESFL